MAPGCGLQAGDRAPEFALPDADGHIVRLSDFEGRMVALFFFPRADTPGCTTEAQDFSALHAEFRSSNVAVVGISADPPAKLAKFRDKYGLAVTLLAAERLETLRAYGVWGEKSMYGKTFEGIIRSTFLISPSRKVLESWCNVRVKNHAATVLSSVQNLG